MPDGDIFERSLHGRFWPKAYRLACADDSFDQIGDRLVKAVAAALRGPFNCPSLIRKTRDAVFEGLKEKARGDSLNLSGEHRTEPFGMLCALLDDIAAEHSNSAAARVAAKTAKGVYLALESDCASVKAGQVGSSLAMAFGLALVKNQWLARVREGIMGKTKRSCAEQATWEDKLSAHVAPRLQTTVSQLFQVDRKAAVRAARRTTPQRKMTLEELHQGIEVMEVEHV